MRSSLLAILVLIPGPLLAAEKGRKFALLIGVSKYDPAQLHDLPHAEKDVSDFADVLVKKCGFRNDHVHLMTSSQGAKKFRYSPTAKNIRRMLSNLVQFCEKDDTLILGFAGHGIQFTREKDNYFCPTDADLEKKSTLINLQKEVYLILEKKCAARVKLLFVDACRNDPRTRQARSRATVDLQKLNRPQALEMPKGLAAFFSCRAGEESFEDRNLGHGVFFHFVIKGLNGGAANRKGDVTLPRLRSYVRTEVSAYVFNKFGKVQRPDLKENSTDVITLVGEPEAAPPKKTTLAREITNSIGMKLRLIPAGTFLMGAPTGKGYADEHPQHEVEITKPFYMGVYEVTQEQYQRIMGKNPSVFSKDGTYRGQVQGVDTTSFPVENVSWNDAVEFCKKLRALSEVFRLNRVYRLPTEAEWEYACRGGAKKYQEFAFGDALSSKKANFKGTSPFGGAEKGPTLGRTCKVGSYSANAFGLYDMHGNALEWCSDWYHQKAYPNSKQIDPTGPGTGERRIQRGGYYRSSGFACRSAYRTSDPPKDRAPYSGFRVVLEIK